MVTDGFRLCSPGPEVALVGVFPLTIVVVFTDGTAGGIATLPFTGEEMSDLPCCEPFAGVEDGIELPEAEEVGSGFLVALA